MAKDLGTTIQSGYEMSPPPAERHARYVNAILEPLRKISNEFFDDQKTYLSDLNATLPDNVKPILENELD